MTQTFYPAFNSTELADNSNKAITIDNQHILVCKANGEYYAVQNQCTHQRSELEGGRIRNCFISCPLHGVRFDLRNGNPKGELTRIPLKTFEVRVNEAGMLEVAI
jgi:3-phenylpropionate/trans-cinnamate dioxygenase ferredoxin subunit